MKQKYFRLISSPFPNNAILPNLTRHFEVLFYKIKKKINMLFTIFGPCWKIICPQKA